MKTATRFSMFAAIAILLGVWQPVYCQVVLNDDTGETFSTLQAAIDDPQTLDGHTLLVGPGDYYENVLVDKQLTILGPKEGIPGYSPMRGYGEAVLYPPSVWYGDGTFNGGYLMRVTADNVTIDGLTLDGDNPALEGVYEANTGAFDIDFGIMSYWSAWHEEEEDPDDMIGDNLVVRNNVIANYKISGLILWGSPAVSAHSYVERNLIRNAASLAGVFLADNHYADIEDNAMEDCMAGVISYLYYNPSPIGRGGYIRNNDIQLRSIDPNWADVVTSVTGIHCTFNYSFADAWTIEDNALHNASNAGDESVGIAITIDGTEDPLVVRDNDISGFDYGYRLSMNWFGTTITGGTLNHNRYGVTVSNWNYNGNFPASVADFTVTGMDILNSLEAGVYVEDHETALEPEVSDPYFIIRVDNCTIDGSPYGVLVDHPDGNAFVHETDLSGNDVAIANFSPQTVEATCNWYGHWTGPDLPPPSSGQGQAVEGLVAFDPWLIDGTDLQPGTLGFQPDPDACVPISCGNNGSKFLVCHNGKTKCVGYADALLHLAHGDPLGACAGESYQVDLDSPFDGVTDAALPEVVAGPNPFDRELTITYEMPAAGNAILRIYDAMGREVHAGTYDDQVPGTRVQDIRTSTWGPGLYIYRLIIRTPEGTKELTGKLVKD